MIQLSHKGNIMEKELKINAPKKDYYSSTMEYFMLGHGKTEQEMFENEHNQQLLELDFAFLRYLKKARPDEYEETVNNRFDENDRKIIDKYNLHIVQHALKLEDVYKMKSKRVKDDFDNIF